MPKRKLSRQKSANQSVSQKSSTRINQANQIPYISTYIPERMRTGYYNRAYTGRLHGPHRAHTVLDQRRREERDALVESNDPGKYTREYQRQLAAEVRSARLLRMECERRKARREVLHASGHAGSKQKYPNRKPAGRKIKC